MGRRGRITAVVVARGGRRTDPEEVEESDRVLGTQDRGAGLSRERGSERGGSSPPLAQFRCDPRLEAGDGGEGRALTDRQQLLR